MDRPEDRRKLTHTEEYYPHPAEGLDVEAARGRVEANPEVMPPHPSPRATRRSWQNREVMGMRALPLLGTLAAAFGLPLLVGWLSRRPKAERPMAKPERPMARLEHRKARRAERGKAEGGKQAFRRAKRAAWEKTPAGMEMGMREFARFARGAKGMPRFVVLASRPWGRKGKKARALILGKVTP